jgi:hypothetical protein
LLAGTPRYGARMKISVKDFQVNMDLGNKGLQLDVYDTDDKYLGDLRIGKAKLERCKGKIHTGNGKTKTWKELIEWFES